MGIVDEIMKPFRANPAYKTWAVVARFPEGDVVLDRFRAESEDCAKRIREDFYHVPEVLWFGLESDLPAEYAAAMSYADYYHKYHPAEPLPPSST